jgi:pyruvate formate lyase activating enzyme
MGNERGMIFDIRRFSIHDGPGIRTTVFFKGCQLRCLWCHNPESQSPLPELIIQPRRCTLCGECIEACPNGAIYRQADQLLTDRDKCQLCQVCAQTCPAEARQFTGHEMDTVEVMVEILRDRAFYDQSGGGVTFSGGEPLFQAKFLASLLQACKEVEIHTALDTCGFAPFHILNGLRDWVDLFLFDLKHLDDEHHHDLTGVSNQMILENLESLSGSGHDIYLRIPLIPTINDDPEHLKALARYVAGLDHVLRVDLLPYHATGKEKYARLDKPFPMPSVEPISKERLGEIQALFQSYGIDTSLGG